MHTNDKMVFVVRDLNVLIKEYGLAQITHALKYIKAYPQEMKQYRFPNTIGTGSDWLLSESEFQQIESTNPRVNKIQAIKTFREITSCGLAEAKGAIERYYDIGYKY